MSDPVPCGDAPSSSEEYRVPVGVGVRSERRVDSSGVVGGGLHLRARLGGALRGGVEAGLGVGLEMGLQRSEGVNWGWGGHRKVGSAGQRP